MEGDKELFNTGYVQNITWYSIEKITKKVL